MFCQTKILLLGPVSYSATTKCLKNCFKRKFAITLGSIPPSGAFLGSIAAGFLLERFGRKNTIMTASPIATIGWILISTASQYEYFIIGRFLSGFSVGLCLPSAQIYVIINNFYN